MRTKSAAAGYKLETFHKYMYIYTYISQEAAI